MTLDSFFSSRRELSPMVHACAPGSAPLPPPLPGAPFSRLPSPPGVNFPPWFTPARRAAPPCLPRCPAPPFQDCLLLRRELSPMVHACAPGGAPLPPPAARRPLFKTAFSSGVNFPPWFTPARRAASPATPAARRPLFETPEVEP